MRRIAFALIVIVLGSTPVAAQRPGEEPWQIVRPVESSRVFARDGTLIGEIGRESRTNVSITTLPRYVPQAFVAVEDQRFYEHDGVDVVGIAGAIKDNLLGGSRGASTITQQLVGNMHPEIIDRTDRSIGRKLREQAAAREMERHYSKAQILEAYLNQIHFGHGWYGIESAARHYFGKPASRLTLVEAASLAALPKGPAIYDPIDHPARNKTRRNVVLTLMQEQGYITAGQARAAKREPVRTDPHRGLPVAAPYFVDAVRAQAERAGLKVGTGGYRIITTLDPSLQRAAVDALANVATEIEARPGYRHASFAGREKGSTDYLQGAVVAIDPATGDVRALVGGRDHGASPFNRATNAVRQPGSAFKPFVYARALMDSVPPNAILYDVPVEIAYDATVYSPDNADGEFLGPLTMREALAQSRNPVAVQLWQRAGADSVIALAHRAGLDAPIAPYPSSAIGASAVRPIDLVSAFTAFANLGAAVEPRLIVSVEDDRGLRVLAETTTVLAPAMDTAVAFVTRELMREAVESGTARSVRRYIPESVPVAGKTGTTNDNADVWFVGMTPDIVAGVWLGFDSPKTIMPGAGGGSLAGPIFGEMLSNWDGLGARDVAAAGTQRVVVPDSGAVPTTAPDSLRPDSLAMAAMAAIVTPAGPWAPPAMVVAAELDRATGLLADEETPAGRRYVEYFVPGTEPTPLRVDARRLFRLGPIAFF
ncbi:MAG TPA: PBP1A family penicillin-binding protein [Gemmatimonadaceae bacterium]|nr:PBP1A family penicillin-binding protein [Gemmatimonadaceae bacterium]